MADKLHNARAMLADYSYIWGTFWARFNAFKEEQAWYYRQLLDVFNKRNATQTLLKEFTKVVTDLIHVIEKGVY